MFWWNHWIWRGAPILPWWNLGPAIITRQGYPGRNLHHFTPPYVTIKCTCMLTWCQLNCKCCFQTKYHARHHIVKTVDANIKMNVFQCIYLGLQVKLFYLLNGVWYLWRTIVFIIWYKVWTIHCLYFHQLTKPVHHNIYQWIWLKFCHAVPATSSKHCNAYQFQT